MVSFYYAYYLISYFLSLVTGICKNDAKINYETQNYLPKNKIEVVPSASSRVQPEKTQK